VAKLLKAKKRKTIKVVSKKPSLFQKVSIKEEVLMVSQSIL